ncbi:DUF5683 domain-containing protein [uncultured Alistipes sp.]|uniref:DUF5683 domain-containing protein n=1 Tax=uncultured Alistipes sp. TaxID=538949 RepID=UPI0028063016|nr:DUF5683 domain-containing protein [uncultured Alistipes sp.]
MKHLIWGLFILLSGSITQSIAQNSSALKPQWIGNVPRNSSTDFYFVEVHSDVASSLSGARISIMKELSAGVENINKISVREIYHDSSIQEYSSNTIQGYSSDFYQLKLQVEGESQPIRSRRIDEYWRTISRGGSKIYDYYALYAVERRGICADFSTISTTSSYGVRGLWRSAIIPGWGQFHKGANLKGGLIFGGCAILATGIVFTENQRSDYARKIVRTHDQNLINSYATKRDHFTAARNICIGAAITLYVYNLIDAIATPGARRIIVKSRKNTNYSLIPTINSNYSICLQGALNF